MPHIFEELLVGHFYNGKSQHLIAQREALLEHLDHGVFPVVFVFHMHHGIVLFRVKGLSGGVHRFNAQLFEALFELVEHHFKALAVGRLFVAVLGKAALEVIVNAQQRLDRVDLRVGVKAFLFLRGALAVVVVLGGQAEVLL